MATGGPCQFIQDAIDSVQAEIDSITQELQDPSLSVAERKQFLQARGLARLELRQKQGDLRVCLANPSAYLLQLDAMEVTQAIQDLGHSVPLIAGKGTVVRVYLSYFGTPGISVRGSLAVGGQTIPSSNVVALNAAQAGNVAAKRKDATLSLNFTLPDVCTAPGQLSVNVAAVTNDSTGNAITVGRLAARSVQFNPSPQLRVRLLAMRYRQGNPAVAYAPSSIDFDHLVSWLRRAYPVPKVLVISSISTVDAVAAAPFLCGDVNAQIAAIRALDMSEGGDNRTHYYALTSDGGFFMRGCAAGVPQTVDPSTVASGPTGSGTWGWDNDGSYGDWYGAHELGHTFGRKHPGFCGESQDDLANYPYANGQLANNDTGFVGFDVGDDDLGLPMMALPGMGWHDVMTYCTTQWLSAYTYQGILNRLLAENAPSPGPQSGDAGRPDERVPLAATGAPPGGPERGLVSVVASVNLTTATGKIEYVNPLSRGAVGGLEKASSVRLRIVGPKGQRAAEYGVAVKLSSELDPGADRTGLVDAVIELPPGARAIELWVGETLADKYEAGAPVPETSSLGTVAPSESVTSLTWSPPTHDSHSYAVQASIDGGQTWSTLAVGLKTPEYHVEHDQFAGANKVSVRVLGTNGFERTVVGTQTLDLRRRRGRASVSR